MIRRPDEYGHNNPDYAIADSDSVRGGGRVVADLTALYALSSKTDQLKVRVTRVWVIAEATYYVLKDLTNVSNADGWEIESTGESVEYSTNIEADKLSTTKVSAIKTLYDWAIGKFQSVLVSGTNIKTINSTSILGSGDIVIEAGSVDYDDLTDKPQINSVELSGNKTTTDLNLDIYTGATAPINPTEKVQWLDTTSGIKYEYVLGTWVELGPQSVSSEGSGATSHTALLDKDAEPTFQHLDTTTEKTTPIDADSFGLWDSVTSTFKRLSVANMLTWFRGLPHTFSQLITFSGGLKTTKIIPNSDTTNAIRFTKADGNTDIVMIDSINNSFIIKSANNVGYKSDFVIKSIVDELNPGKEALHIYPTSTGVRAFFGASGKFFNSLNLKYVNALEDVPTFMTKDAFAVGYGASSHCVGRTGNTSVLRGSGGGLNSTAISFNGGPNYENNNKLMSILCNGNIGVDKITPQSKMHVNGGIQCADDTAAASLLKAGTTRYRETANNSYYEVCVKNGANSYIWKAINTETW
jgi:hypothetical protein